MPEIIFISICVIAGVSLILIPVYLRNRLQQKQLDTIARAIEQGVDLDKVRGSLGGEKSGDVNGNWKAGIIVIGIGVAGLLGSVPTLIQEGLNKDMVAPLLLLVIGGVLLFIHHSIIGKVIRQER